MASGSVVWVTGLSSSGKTTLCNGIWKLVKSRLPELVLLDGDMIREAFGNDLGYNEEDRIVQVKRTQNLAKMLSRQGLVVVVAMLYSNSALLNWNRCNIEDYFEVYLKASMATVRSRDAKCLYAKAEAGKIGDVVGMDIAWHAPEAPDLVITTNNLTNPDELARQVVAAIPRLASALKGA